MRSQNTGQIRIIEAFLAVLIIFTSFTIASNLTVRPNIKKSEDLASIGFQALIKLDSDGTLGKLIDHKNWTAIRDAFDIVLPTGICFNLTVYDDEMHQINDSVISNGSFSSQEIAFVEYVCASQSTVFRCYIVCLQLAVAQ